MEVKKMYRLLRIITLCIVTNSLLSLMDATKEYVYSTASFDRYINITNTSISDAVLDGKDLYYTHKFERIVKLRDAYPTTVVTEFVCTKGGNKKNTVETWLLEREGNPGVVTEGVKIEGVYIERGDTCRTNRTFTVNPNGYPISTTTRSNDFTVK